MNKLKSMAAIAAVSALSGCGQGDIKTASDNLEKASFELGVQSGINGMLVLERDRLLGKNVPAEGMPWMNAVRGIAYTNGHHASWYVAQ